VIAVNGVELSLCHFTILKHTHTHVRSLFFLKHLDFKHPKPDDKVVKKARVCVPLLVFYENQQQRRQSLHTYSRRRAAFFNFTFPFICISVGDYHHIYPHRLACIWAIWFSLRGCWPLLLDCVG
jgi:hypothetical protein